MSLDTVENIKWDGGCMILCHVISALCSEKKRWNWKRCQRRKEAKSPQSPAHRRQGASLPWVGTTLVYLGIKKTRPARSARAREGAHHEARLTIVWILFHEWCKVLGSLEISERTKEVFPVERIWLLCGSRISRHTHGYRVAWTRDDGDLNQGEKERRWHHIDAFDASTKVDRNCWCIQWGGEGKRGRGSPGFPMSHGELSVASAETPVTPTWMWAPIQPPDHGEGKHRQGKLLWLIPPKTWPRYSWPHGSSKPSVSNGVCWSRANTLQAPWGWRWKTLE